MKNKYLISSLLFGTFLLLVGCTKLTDINKNPYQITEDQYKSDGRDFYGTVVQMANSINYVAQTWRHQLQHNLMGDIFSKQQVPPTPFAGNSNNMTLKLVAGWNGYLYDLGKSEVIATWLALKSKLDEKKELTPLETSISGLSDILKVKYMHMIVDTYGGLPYPENAGDVEYKNAKECYDIMFRELDRAITKLDESKLTSLNGFSREDPIYSGNISKWRKFANSLKLRLAMRISKAEPALSKEKAEEAIESGLILINNDSAIQNPGSYANPYAIYSDSWLDSRMSASMEVYLKGYDDGRIEKYFSPIYGYKDEDTEKQVQRIVFFDADGTKKYDPTQVKYDPEASENSSDKYKDYKGIRVGIEIKDKNQYVQFSPLGEYPKTHLPIITASEVQFLLAEAALRGYAGAGDASAHYQQGINFSFAQAGATMAGLYLTGTTNPIDYVDPLNPENNVSLSNATSVNFEGTNEEKLQKIITQKWISLYPNGTEAWTEYRRTGYPKLLPYKLNNSGGKLDSNLGPRRIPIAASEKNTNGANVEAFLSAEGWADDSGAEFIFWDVEKTGGNF